MRAPPAPRRLLFSAAERVSAAPTLAEALARGDRRALARAITLIESARPDHRDEAERLLSAVLAASGGAVRIGISGPPGAGKSTFIEQFGIAGIDRGHRVAVLAVDPASKRGGGAILADKTRMAALARSPSAFIRPSSADTAIGGVARRTREAILLCEAAGFDAVIVESVGAGQSDTAVSEMTDMFVLILPPAAGDELQGIKRGIVELADLILVNKADSEFADAAARTAAEYANAMRLVRPPSAGWTVPVRAVSALENRGIAEVWDDIGRYRSVHEASSAWTRRRRDQARAALWAEVEAGLVDYLRRNSAVAGRLDALEVEVVAGTRLPAEAARTLLGIVFSKG